MSALRQTYFIFMENFQGGLERFETNLFHFHGEFSEKLMKNQVKLTNRIPLCEFEPLVKKSWICPCFQWCKSVSVNVFLKIQMLFSFFSQEMVIRAGIHKLLDRIAKREDPDQTASEVIALPSLTT